MIRHVFFDHPATVDETYAEHAWFASSFALKLLAAASAAAIHALVPCLFEKTASGIIDELHTRIHNR